MLKKEIICLYLLCLAGCQQTKPERERVSERLAPFYTLKPEPQPGEWLAQHPEKYESFEAYTRSKPIVADSLHTTIYVALIGSMSDRQKEIAVKTASYLQVFYGLKTRFLRLADTIAIHKNARKHPVQGNLQLSAPYLLEVLKQQLPPDAATLIGFTAVDLYPAPEWNYVFGLASLQSRVGIWSVYRFGNPEIAYEECLMNTIKTAVHETGHMFSLGHCIKYDCCMNGSNHLTELASQPVYFCPDCLSKLCWNRRESVKAHLLRCYGFWKAEKNVELAAFYSKNLEALKSN